MLVGNPPFTNTQKGYGHARVGDFTYGTPTLGWWDEGCSIGKFCSIGPGVAIFGGGEHNTQWVSTYPFSVFGATFPQSVNTPGHPRTKGPTVIGNDVWLGARSLILSGVHVGDGAVVGAGTVVTRSVPPYGIVAGNPARLIRYRFPEEDIKELLAVRWWDFPLDIIRCLLPLLQSPRIDLFLRAARLCRQELDARSGAP